MNCKYIVYQLITSILIILQFSCSNNSDENCNCDLVPEVGNCEAAIPIYYFDQEEKMCKEFIWGGCDGVVPFDTLEQCEECECN